MFRAIRLKLIAYVAAVLATVLLAVGTLVYVLLTRQFDAAVNTQLRSHLPPPPSSGPVSIAAGFAVGPAPGLPDIPPDCTVSTTPLGTSVNCPGDPPRTGPPGLQAGGTSADAEPGQSQGFVVSHIAAGDGPDDGTFLIQWVNGQLDGPDKTVPPGLPDLAAMAAARPGHDDQRTVRVGGQRYRLITRTVSPLPPPLPGPAPGPVLTLQAGISLANRDREERIVLLALAGGGMLGLLLTVAGGLLLTSRAVAPLQLAFERQRRFVADASHELRTPLALVRLEAEDLAQRLNSVEETRPLLRQVSRVSDLVEKLLTLAQLDHGALPLESEPVHVATTLGEVARAASRLAAAGVQTEVSASSDLWATGDRGRVHQTLLILVDNACRATPPGGRIDLTARAERTEVVLRVADTGAGIPPAHLQRVFERFHRVDLARSRSRGGAGLGLAIAQELARAQRGRVELSSVPGVGTTATLRLPLAPIPSSPDPELEPVGMPTDP